jgi:hypothetical protein
VTASIKQDGDNQVHVITNTAQRTASIEFAKAAAVRPEIVGQALAEVAQDPEVNKAMFEILEAQKMLEGHADILLVPKDQKLVTLLEKA